MCHYSSIGSTHERIELCPDGYHNCMLLQTLAAAAMLAASTPSPAAVVDATMAGSVSSATAKVGDSFTFTTVQPVQVNGLHIPAGTLGHGVVTAVSAAAGTHRGTLSLQPQYLILAGGTHEPVQAVDSTAYAARRHLFPFPVPLPGVILIGGVQNPGSDVTIGPGTHFRISILPNETH